MRTVEEIKKLSDKELISECKRLDAELADMNNLSPAEQFDFRKKGCERDALRHEIDDRDIVDKYES